MKCFLLSTHSKWSSWNKQCLHPECTLKHVMVHGKLLQYFGIYQSSCSRIWLDNFKIIILNLKWKRTLYAQKEVQVLQELQWASDKMDIYFFFKLTLNCYWTVPEAHKWLWVLYELQSLKNPVELCEAGENLLDYSHYQRHTRLDDW